MQSEYSQVAGVASPLRVPALGHHMLVKLRIDPSFAACYLENGRPPIRDAQPPIAPMTTFRSPESEQATSSPTQIALPRKIEPDLSLGRSFESFLEWESSSPDQGSNN